MASPWSSPGEATQTLVGIVQSGKICIFIKKSLTNILERLYLNLTIILNINILSEL